MEFCSSCGILLPLEVVGKRFCLPCEKRDHQCRTDSVCQCDICGTARPLPPSPPSPRHFDSNNEIAVNNSDPSSPSTIAKNKNRHKRSKQSPSAGGGSKKQAWKFDECDNDDGGVALDPNSSSVMQTSAKSIDESSNANDKILQDWSDAVDDWGDTTMKPLHDWSQIVNDSPIHNDRDNAWDCGPQALKDDQEPMDWVEVRKKKPPRSAVFGDHEFPVLDRGLKESAVVQNVRDEWEREQDDYKSRLEFKDTPDITWLTSGHRRKSKNRRFFVGGVDISFVKDNTDACACLSIVRMPDLELVYQRMEMIQMRQPYIPGFLAFREVPHLVELFESMKAEAPQYMPDVIMVDGNGILHPKGCGLASQLGVTLDIPTVGVAKTLMTAQGIVDDFDHKKRKQTLLQAGDGFDLIADSGEVLGKCVRVHDNAPNPVYVSVGHKITLKSAVWLTLECSKYRIPEPIRRADLDSREYIRLGKTGADILII